MQTNHSRLGLVLFFLYLLLYGGFMLINTFSPSMMEATPVAGLNVAILYGSGLIIAAFVFAIIYGMFAKSTEDDS